MNFYKGKLMRIEYGKVDKLKVCIAHIYYERKDKVKLLIEMPANANDYRKLKKEFNTLKQEKKDIFDVLRDIVEGVLR